MFWHVLIKKLMTVFIGEVLVSAELDEVIHIHCVDDSHLVCLEVLAYQLDIRVHREGDLWMDVVRGTQQAQGGNFRIEKLE